MDYLFKSLVGITFSFIYHDTICYEEMPRDNEQYLLACLKSTLTQGRE